MKQCVSIIKITTAPNHAIAKSTKIPLNQYSKAVQ